MTRQYALVAYLDDEEGGRAVEALCNVQGVVAYGPTAESIEQTLDRLLQWESPDGEPEWTAEPGSGLSDPRCTVDDYLLTWNLGLGYISLYRMRDAT